MSLSNTRIIDTRNRFSGTTTNGEYRITRAENVSFFKIDKVSYFNSQYSVDERNNKMVFDQSGSLTATIVSGQYSGTTLCSAVETALNLVGSGFTCTYVTSSNKITISHASNFELTTTNTTNSLYDYLGYDTSANLTGTNSYTGTNMVNITSKYVYLTLSFADNPQLSLNLPDTVALIILNTRSWGSLITQDDPVIIRSNERHFEYFKYALYDDRGNVIDSNGIEFSFRITFL